MYVPCLVCALLVFCHVSLDYGSASGYDRAARIQEEDIEDIESDLEKQLEEGDGPNFMNQWAVRLTGGPEVADIVARDLGYLNNGQIGALHEYYLFVREDHPRRSKRSADHHTRSLQEDHRVEWVEQQYQKYRMKRDFRQDTEDERQEERAYRSVNLDDEYWERQWYLTERKKRATEQNDAGNVVFDENDLPDFSDPTFPNEWYLLPDFFDSEDDDSQQKMDLRVIPVWAMNITGRGVVVSVLDDGVDYNHPDLISNYEPAGSYDFNDDDPDPSPHVESKSKNKHGTRCAGEIAMAANNGICGVGVAFNAKIGGIRMLDGEVTDTLEAKALTFGLDTIDIFSASWGPNDNGKVVEGPGRLASAAFEQGITEGRGGKGVIYVWASGNGGENGDNCDCDGYTGSIHTLSISSASQSRHYPWYSEACASTMATTYSSGALNDKKVVTTDLRNKCTLDHTGTSASAPLAAGIFALLLEMNPELTWRDVQHLVAWTAHYDPLKSNEGWKTNAAGFRVNSHFGYGLISAVDLVKTADPETYETVPEKFVCTVDSDVENNADFPIAMSSNEIVQLKVTTTGCKGQSNAVKYLEHIQVYLSMEYSKRGVLEIWLTSPSGTNTTLLTPRRHDHSESGFKNWPFMSVHTWMEDPTGDWYLGVKDTGHGENMGQITGIKLVMHGMKRLPKFMKKNKGKRKYPTEFEEYTKKKKVPTATLR